METIKIRKAKIEDAKYLVSLSEQIDYPTPEKIIKKRLKDVINQDEDIFLVAETKDHQVIGFVHGITIIEVLTPKTLRLGGLVVDATYRKGGIGRKLMHTLEAMAKKKKFEILIVPTNIKRKKVHPFYERIGYKLLKTQLVYCKTYKY